MFFFKQNNATLFLILLILHLFTNVISFNNIKYPTKGYRDLSSKENNKILQDLIEEIPGYGDTDKKFECSFENTNVISRNPSTEPETSTCDLKNVLVEFYHHLVPDKNLLWNCLNFTPYSNNEGPFKTRGTCSSVINTDSRFDVEMEYVTTNEENKINFKYYEKQFFDLVKLEYSNSDIFSTTCRRMSDMFHDLKTDKNLFKFKVQADKKTTEIGTISHAISVFRPTITFDNNKGTFTYCYYINHLFKRMTSPDYFSFGYCYLEGKTIAQKKGLYQIQMELNSNFNRIVHITSHKMAKDEVIFYMPLNDNKVDGVLKFNKVLNKVKRQPNSNYFVIDVRKALTNKDLEKMPLKFTEADLDELSQTFSLTEDKFAIEYIPKNKEGQQIVMISAPRK